MFPYFEFFGKTVGTYGLCSVLGLAFCVFLATVLGKRYKYAFEDVLLLTLSVCGGILAGGHLMYGITQLENIIKVFSKITEIPFSSFLAAMASCFGGMVYYGGFLGGAAAVAIHSKFSKNVEYPYTMDLYACMIPLFHTFGRIGCFLGGCCYGREWSWGFAAAENPYVPEMAGPVRIPVQLLEAGCNLAIFAVILIMFIKKKCCGKLIFVYLLIYPAVRFILEFFRGDLIRGIFFGLSTSQWISIFLFTFALIRMTIYVCGRSRMTA